MRWRNTTVLVAALAMASCGPSPYQPSSAPTIAQVQPTTVAIGGTITLVGSGFTAGGNVVEFGDGYLGATLNSDTTVLRFTVPDYLDPCAPTAEMCIATIVMMTPGPYRVVVSNANGRSNAVTVQVTGK
jgi:hypothetical protein